MGYALCLAECFSTLFQVQSYISNNHTCLYFTSQIRHLSWLELVLNLQQATKAHVFLVGIAFDYFYFFLILSATISFLAGLTKRKAHFHWRGANEQQRLSFHTRKFVTCFSTKNNAFAVGISR